MEKNNQQLNDALNAITQTNHKFVNATLKRLAKACFVRIAKDQATK